MTLIISELRRKSPSFTMHVALAMLVVLVGVFTMNVPAVATEMVYPLKVLPADHTTKTDPVTGAELTIHIINIAKGQVKEVCKIRPPAQWHGHLQWSRTPSNLLSLAGGDDWYREGSQDRIWIVDPTEGVLRSVYHQIEGELVTHESWWVNDQILFCGAPPAVGFEGDPLKRELSHVKTLDSRTGTVRIIGAGSWWPEGSDAAYLLGLARTNSNPASTF